MYNKKALSKATAELDKAKAPAKPKDIITDPMGQWKYPGLPTRIPGNDITMRGVGYPVVGVADTGQRQIMLPGADYTFPGADYVDEYPQMKKGGTKKRKTKSISGTNKLLEVNELFKNYKNRRFDPKAKHFQDGGEYIEADLTDDEIEEYRKGGFIVEDISVPELNQAKKGKSVNISKSPKPSVYTAKNDKDYAFRKKAYDDSLAMYNLSTLNNMLANNYAKDPDVSEKEQIEYVKKNDAYIQKMKKIKAQSAVKLGDVFGKPTRPTQMIVEPYKTEVADIIDKRAPKPGVKKVNVDKAVVKDSVRQLEQPAAKLIEKSITQPVKQPVVKQSKYPEGYQPYSLYGKVLDPEVYGYAESLNGKPVQVTQFADTYGYKAKMDTYKKSGQYPWKKQKGGMVAQLTPKEIQEYINQGYIVEEH